MNTGIQGKINFIRFTIFILAFVSWRQVRWEADLLSTKQNPNLEYDPNKNLNITYENNQVDAGINTIDEENIHVMREMDQASLTLQKSIKELMMQVNNGTKELPIPPSQQTLGAFVHVSKSGGSTLSYMLRYGCHSIIMKKGLCNKVSIWKSNDDSFLSKTVQYYHVPDFENRKLWKSMELKRHQYYVFTVRDPLFRAISAYLVSHPANDSEFKKYLKVTNSVPSNSTTNNITEAKLVVEFHKKTLQPRKKRKVYLDTIKLYDCFFTLEEFAKSLGDNPNDYKEGKWKDFIDKGDCSNVAKLAMHNRVDRMRHNYWNLQQITKVMSESMWNETIMMTIRTEYIMEDFITVNKFLGQDEEDIVMQLHPTVRNFTALSQPIKKELSTEGQRNLCKSLEPEYKVYLKLLAHSRNLSPEDVNESLKLAQELCPWLNLTLEDSSS